MKTFKVWGICQNEAPRFAVFADQPRNSVVLLLAKQEFMVDGLAMLGIGIVLPILFFTFRNKSPLFSFATRFHL